MNSTAATDYAKERSRYNIFVLQLCSVIFHVRWISSTATGCNKNKHKFEIFENSALETKPLPSKITWEVISVYLVLKSTEMPNTKRGRR